MPAFDTVNRTALWLIPRKFGLPEHFINIVVRLHTGTNMKFKVGKTDTNVPSNIEVRQGARLAAKGPPCSYSLCKQPLRPWTGQLTSHSSTRAKPEK